MKWASLSVSIVMFVVFITLFSVFSTAPKSDQALIAAYERIVPKYENGPWIDVYVFDYFFENNQFQNVTPETIAEHAAWFFVPGKPGKPGTKGNPKKHIPSTPPVSPVPPTHLSLVQALEEHGLSQDIQAAVIMEGELAGSFNVVFGLVQEKTLRYHNYNVNGLISWLASGGSSFTSVDIAIIDEAARSVDVNPLLLVAITGQEESFVPKNWPAAQQILKNPFNVNVSWQDYAPGLYVAAKIAAQTVALKLSTTPPKGEDPIAWMNDTRNPDGIYATDRHWADGVQSIFMNLESQFGS